jgi:hypothetical protein
VTGALRVLGRSGASIIDASIAQLKAAWQQPLSW